MSSTCLAPLLTALTALSAATARQGDAPLAGWYNVFPANVFFPFRMLRAPTVGKDTTGPPSYSQTMRYDAATGLERAVDVTLARDPAFRQRYAAAALRKLKDPPREVKVGKHTAWIWKDGSRIVVPFASDGALIIVPTPHSVAKLTHLPAAFDLDRIEQALRQPPRTDFRRRLETFRVIRKGDPMAAVADWSGPANGSEKLAAPTGFRWRFDLPDGSAVLVEERQKKVVAVRHVAKGGKTTALVE